MTLHVSEAAELIDRERLVGRLAELVRTPSENPPGNEAEVASLVAGFCREAGLEVSTHEDAPGRTSVLARRPPGDASGGRKVGYCSHIDTVPIGDPNLWERDPLGAEVAGGRMHGRGTCDAKGCVAAALEAVEILGAAGFEAPGSLELALVADEETMGFVGAAPLVEQGIFRPEVAIVGEPTSIRVVRAQRGASWMRLETRGVASHGSAPERGVNAILHMAEILSHLIETLPDVSHEILGGPSINVGTIQGGAKVNIVAAGCVAEIDRRTVPGETRESVLETIREAIDRARERLPDIDADVDIAFFGEPFETSVDAGVVRHVSAAVAEASGRDAQLIGFRGASDARFLAEAGTEVVVCGPGDIGLAHTARELIELEELERCALAYALAFARLMNDER